MKKNIIMLLLLVAAGVRAETVTSTVDGGVINTLPKVGQIVKKGEMLVTFYHTSIDAQIDGSKVEVEEAKELLKNKNLDKERANKLVGRGVSRCDWEDAMYDATYAKLELEKSEANLRKLESDKSLRFIAAPCDCKIIKVYMFENSGTAIGDKILEVERLK